MLSVIRTVPVGVDLQAFGTPGGQAVSGIIIDNPSGDWLLVQPGNNLFVPPYQMGWAHSFLPTTASVNVLATTFGAARALPPAGQVSTLQGDPYTVKLYDEPVGESNGVSVLPPIIPTQQSAVTTFGVTIPFNSIGIVLIPAVANKVIRVLYVSAAYVGISDISAFVTLIGAANFIFLQLAGVTKPDDTLVFPDKGIFLPIGRALTANVQTIWQVGGAGFAFPMVQSCTVFGQFAYV